jgi:AcrR family transcriptional regulator
VSASQTLPRTQAERTRDSERRLVRAALELIAERGIERTTLRAIGERAGTSRGLANYHFGSKEELLRKAVNELLRGWSRRVLEPAVVGRVGFDALRAALAQHRELLRRDPDVRAYYTLVYAALGPMPELRGDLARAHAAQRRRVAGWIAAGIEVGEIRADADPVQQAGLYLGALRGIVYQWMIDPESIDLGQAYDTLIGTLEAGLAR